MSWGPNSVAMSEHADVRILTCMRLIFIADKNSVVTHNNLIFGAKDIAFSDLSSHELDPRRHGSGLRAQCYGHRAQYSGSGGEGFMVGARYVMVVAHTMVAFMEEQMILTHEIFIFAPKT